MPHTIKDILRESIEEFAKISIFNENPIEHNGEQGCDKNLANAFAKVLIHLLESKLITI